MISAKLKILLIVAALIMIFLTQFLNQFYGWNLSQDWMINLTTACILSAWLIILIVEWIIRHTQSKEEK